MTSSLCGYNLMEWLERQVKFSSEAFGPGDRAEGIAAHIRKELDEALDSNDLEEWIDIAILALDQAWRCSDGNIGKVVMMLHNKQQKNMRRRWPNYRVVPVNQPIEHIREDDE